MTEDFYWQLLNNKQTHKGESMSKSVIKEKEVKLSDNHVMEPDVDFKGKTDEELKEVRDTLVTQLNQYQTMTIKAAGALEVLNQLLPEEDDSEG